MIYKKKWYDREKNYFGVFEGISLRCKKHLTLVFIAWMTKEFTI